MVIITPKPYSLSHTQSMSFTNLPKENHLLLRRKFAESLSAEPTSNLANIRLTNKLHWNYQFRGLDITTNLGNLLRWWPSGKRGQRYLRTSLNALEAGALNYEGYS